jgi:lysophospholipase L1-like esterase|tara:strand:+ start:177 stop:1481 length:1305 start_codon:yes stop_codon:yes gene_type:complete
MNNKNKFKFKTALALALILPLFAHATNWWEDNLDPKNWTATWATANKTITGFDGPLDTINNATLRQIVRISEAGRMVRVSFSNEFGTAPLNINEAHVALRDSGSAILDSSGNQLTFSGSNSVSILPGARVVSDAVNMSVPDNSEVVISAYLPDDVTGSGSPVTYHVRALQTNYIAAGNQAVATDLESATTSTAWHFLASVDVANYWPMPVIATLGDSITDGDQMGAPNEPIDTNARYPDLLSKAIIAGGKAAGVINLGISGNQVLTSFLGENPAARLNRDVLTQAGVTHVLYLEGINDIGLPVLLSVLGIPTPVNSAEAIIAGHKQVISRAKAAGLSVIGGTLTPSGGSTLPGYNDATAEAKRQTVNAWIRDSGAYDMVIDFDAALADPENPAAMNVELTADGLHPNAAGYQVMADTAFAAIGGILPPKQYEGN